MRKSFATFALLFVLSISIFAEGDISIGGRACPEPEPDQPPPACTVQNPPVNGQSATTINDTDESDDPNILIDVIDYLGSLFG